MTNPRWSDEHEDYLLKNYKIKSFSEIGGILGFCPSTVSYHARKLGLKNCILSRCADKYKLEPEDRLYIALEDLDFSWFPGEVREVVKMWNSRATGEEIIKHIGRDGDEVALLIMDLKRRRKIRNRPGGIYGA